MTSWRFWDWVAYAGLLAAALIMAIDAALKNAPNIIAKMPDFLKSEYWAFLPLALILVSSGIFLVKAIRTRSASDEVFLPLAGDSIPSVRPQQPTMLSEVSSEQILVPVDIYPLHDPNAQGFPHKLCVAVKNESGKDLVVNPARWEKRAASDIAFRRSDYQPWIPEGPNRWEKRDWIWRRSPDRGAIHLPRDRAIMTWVGLHGPPDEIELSQRIVGKRLGTLLVSFTANGNPGTETIKL